MKFFTMLSRPWAYNLITLGWLIITTFYTTRAIVTLLQWNLLSKVYYPYISLYLCLSGITWGFTGLYMLLALWRAKKWILVRIKIISILFFISNIIEWLVISILGNWGKTEIISPILCIIFTGFTFYGTKFPNVISFITKGTYYDKG